MARPLGSGRVVAMTPRLTPARPSWHSLALQMLGADLSPATWEWWALERGCSGSALLPGATSGGRGDLAGCQPAAMGLLRHCDRQS